MPELARKFRKMNLNFKKVLFVSISFFIEFQRKWWLINPINCLCNCFFHCNLIWSVLCFILIRTDKNEHEFVFYMTTQAQHNQNILYPLHILNKIQFCSTAVRSQYIHCNVVFFMINNILRNFLCRSNVFSKVIRWLHLQVKG